MNNEKVTVIAVDHGYGNIKTAHTFFKTGVTACDNEPVFKRDLLIYEGKYYIIGDEHKEFASNKMNDQDYYILTLAAIARELSIRQMNDANVYLAVGFDMFFLDILSN